MGDLVGNANWDQFKDLINQANDTFAQDEVIWRRMQLVPDRWGEDNTGSTTVDVVIRGLHSFNYYRNWPIVEGKDTGDSDDQTTMFILNKKYLNDNGWLNVNGRFDFDMALDRFIFDGVAYKCVGETNISQAKDEALLYALILRKEELNTGTTHNSL